MVRGCGSLRLCHSDLLQRLPRERDFCIDNLLVRIQLIIEMILVDQPRAMGVYILFSGQPYTFLRVHFSHTPPATPVKVAERINLC